MLVDRDTDWANGQDFFAMVSPPETRYAESRDGDSIAFRVMGGGPPDLVFIPPWMSSVELDVDDPYVGPTVRRLASVGRLVSYDKRGGGMSEPLAPGDLPTIEERVDDLVAVLDAVRCEKPTVFAGADGAAIAMMFAATFPERLGALCLYAPFARVIEAPDYPIGYPADVIDAMVEIAEQTWGSGKVAPTAPTMATDAPFLAWFGSYQRRSASPAAGARFLRMAVETDIRDILGYIHVPTVVLHRSGDQLVPIAAGRYVAEHIAGAHFVELPGNDHFWAVGDQDAILDTVEEMATGLPPVPEDVRSLVTILFVDIVGSTKRATELGDQRWRELLDAHDDLVRRQFARFHGREIDSTGDGFLATFDGPGRAVRCACAIRDSIRGLGLEIRAGLHTGEVELRSEGIAGVAVHIAARVCALAGPGEVLVSESLPRLVVGSRLEFADRGSYELRGVPGEWTLYAAEP